jgi:bifunctional DNase/RNase
MNKDVVEVQVRAVLPLDGSFAVFLGSPEKTFVIYVDETVGTAISMFMRGVPKERPLTHDLIGLLLLAFGAKVERVVINQMEGSVFYARLILSAENQLHSRKLIELDARPSDSMALAIHAGAPLFVARQVWDAVEDVSETLAEIEAKGPFKSGGAGFPIGDGSEGDDEEADDDDDESDDEEDLDFDEDEDSEDDDDLFDDDDDDPFDDDVDEDEEDGDGDPDKDSGQGPFSFGFDDDDEGEEWKKGG